MGNRLANILFKLKGSVFMKRRNTSGYSAKLVTTYLDMAKPIRNLSTELTPQYEWVDNKPTDKIVGYRAWFIQEGVDPFTIKFTNKVKLPKYLGKAEFDGLEACEVRNNVYFRAESVKEVK